MFLSSRETLKKCSYWRYKVKSIQVTSWIETQRRQILRVVLTAAQTSHQLSPARQIYVKTDDHFKHSRGSVKYPAHRIQDEGKYGRCWGVMLSNSGQYYDHWQFYAHLILRRSANIFFFFPQVLRIMWFCILCFMTVKCTTVYFWRMFVYNLTLDFSLVTSFILIY